MDPAKMKVVDLRSELGALGLDTKGNKPALVERLKKALEAKTGKAIAETTILDTSTEDADEPATPRRAGPAARTRRRSSSTRVASTPAKVTRVETPEPIAELKEDVPEPQPKEVTPEPEPQPQKEPTPEPEEKPKSLKTPEPQPVPAPEQAREPTPEPEVKPQIHSESEMYNIDDEKSQSPPPVVKNEGDEPMEVTEASSADNEKPSEDQQKPNEVDEDSKKDDAENEAEEEERRLELTEEEEWDQLNERLELKEKERLEREKKQAEEDAKRLEELSNDPVKLQRLKRKHEKKARWSNFYKAVEITNEVLTPPVEDPYKHRGKVEEAADTAVLEPELDDNKITLSWYDSDLNQYIEQPELVSVVPLSEGAFAHAWAGVRASHGVGPASGRVCYEVRVGDAVTTTETTDKDIKISNALRVGWSTEDSTLHLGEGELSFGYESTGRAVHNGEFKEYGKTFTEKDVIGVYLDLDSEPCQVSYTHNGAELGVAHEFDRAALGGKPLFPHVLSKNLCYRVNFGNDKYNLLTKTKIARKRHEIPIEQVLEEKRLKEEAIQRERAEAARKEKERRDKDRKEREDRQRKKRDERDKHEHERKEKEVSEKKDRSEEVSEEKEKEKETEKEKEKEMEKETEKEKEKEKEPADVEMSEEPAEQQDEPKENGDSAADAAEVTQEPGAAPEPAAAADQLTEEPARESEVLPEVTEEQLLKGHVLDKRIKFVTRWTVEQELDGPEASLLPGFVLIARADLVAGPRRPASLADCEVILMVGMPGAGKTHWARAHAAAHPARRYNVLSTAALFDRMQVDCKPFRAACEGRWDAMLAKGAKCVLRLLDFAHGRRRNYILDQRRKLREFEGYRRVAVVVVPAADAYEERRGRRESADGKEVPDGAVMEMKANIALPEKCSWLDEVIYAELGEEDARKAVEQFHKEARAAGVVRERERRDRSASRDQPPAKRPRSAERRHRDDRRKDFSRDREDRWGGGGGGGGGGGSRWGPASRGAPPARWAPRERPAPPPGRFDRPWGPRDNNSGGDGGRGGFGRDRDGFRGGRGGPRGERPDQRFSRGERPRPPGDKRPPSDGGGGGGGWQRGGGGARGRGAGPARGAPHALQRAPPGKEGGGAPAQAGQAGWGQWGAGQWNNWNNWNQQNQGAQQAGWGNWNNWNSNWGNAQGQQAGAGKPGAPAGQQGQQGTQATQQQWQQWYQWQQWQQQQQQQGWPAYNQQQGNAAGAGNAVAQDPQAWAQYYQNYNANAAANAAPDKK